MVFPGEVARGQVLVFVPDLLFFSGSSTTQSSESSGFHVVCLLRALLGVEKCTVVGFSYRGLVVLGVEKCTVVGFSYRGLVAFKMAELRPDLVQSLVISGSVVDMTDSARSAILNQIGYSSLASFLLPNTAEELKTLFSVGSHKKLMIPDILYRNYFKVMFNEHEREGRAAGGMLVIGDTDTGKQPAFTFTQGNCEDCRHQLGQSETVGHQEGRAPRSLGKAMRLQSQAQ